MLKTVEDFQKLTKSQFDAASQSATAFSTGLQAIVTETADYSKKSMEAGNTALQDLFGSRTVESAIRVQMDYAKSAYEALIAGSSKVGSLWSATAQNAYKPLEEAFASFRGTARNAIVPVTDAATL